MSKKTIEQLEGELVEVKALLLAAFNQLGRSNEVGSRIRKYLKLPLYACDRCKDTGRYNGDGKGHQHGFACTCKAGDAQIKAWQNSR